jgi:hypothetical protein
MLTAVTGTADHVRRNRAAWDGWAAEYAGPGLRNWAAAQPSWGIWNIAEEQAGVLPADLGGPGQHRAGLRHRVLVSVAGPPRRADGRGDNVDRDAGRPDLGVLCAHEPVA